MTLFKMFQFIVGVLFATIPLILVLNVIGVTYFTAFIMSLYLGIILNYYAENAEI